MNKKTNVKVDYLYKVLLLCSVLVFLYVFYSIFHIKHMPDSRFIPDPPVSLSEGWYTLDASGGKTTLPELNTWSIKSDAPVTIRRELPPLSDKDYLFIENNFNYIKVFVDGTCIYDYSDDTVDLPANMSGHFICQIPLDRDFSGRTLSVEITQPHTFLSVGIKDISIGTASSYITKYLYSHAELIISLFIMLLASLCLFSAFLWQKYRKLDYNYSVFGELSLLTLISALWIFTDSQLPQLFWGNTVAVCVLSFFSFMVLPLPMLSITSTLCQDSRRVLARMKCVLILNATVQGILYSLGNVSLVLMLPITHSLIVLNGIVLLLFLLHRLKGSSSHFAKPMLLSLILLILSAVLALIQFYINPQADNSRFYRYGFILFISILIYVSVKAMLGFVNDYTEHKILKKLAYTDILTNVGSRLAFEEFMNELRSRTTPFPGVFYVCDLNNLKVTNDTYGHKAGDIILKEAARCMSKIFQDSGKVFRIGGDEFAAFIQAPFHELPDYVSMLEKEIESADSSCEYNFSLSIGWNASDTIIGNEIDRVFRQADDDMYKSKMKYRKENSIKSIRDQ